ncbi:MAG: hypothetical protein ABWX96_20385, partial [Propionibacteriaceae bacterium]
MNETEVRSAPPMVHADDGPDVAARSAPARSVSGVGRRLGRVLAHVVAVAAVAAVVVGSRLFDMEPDILVLSGTVLVRELVPGVVAFAVVGVVVLRRPTATAVGWTMLAMALCWGLAALSMGLWSVSFVAGWGIVAQLWVAYSTLSNVGWVLGMVVLPQVFPTGWLSGWFWRLLFIVPLVGYATFLVVGGTVEWEIYFPDEPALIELETLWAFGSVLGYVTPAIVLIVLVERVRRGPHLVRQQVAPLAVVWLAANGFDLFRSAELSESRSSLAFIAGWLWPVVVALVIAVTVTQVGLWDSRVVVRRFVVYAVVVSALT